MAKSPHVLLPHVRVTFGGTQGTGTSAEIWQCQIKIGDTFGDHGLKIDSLQNYVNSYQAALLTWWTNSGNSMRSDFNLEWTKAANIAGGEVGPGKPGGLYDGSHDVSGGINPAIKAYTSTPGGLTVGTFTPPILTLCYTFRCSLNPKGRPSSVGRIYPPIGFGTNTNRAGAGSTALGVTSAKALLALLTKTGVLAHGGSTVNVSPHLFGWASSSGPIDSVAVGDVVDVQRRRKSRLKDVYATGTVP